MTYQTLEIERRSMRELLRIIEGLDDKTNRLFAVWCAREALKLIEDPDPRSLAGLGVAERFANGEASLDELRAASAAAYDASAAADAALDASAAAYAASVAAAYYAAYAAANAARAAASVVADYAAAAYADVRKAQIEKLREWITLQRCQKA